MAIILAHGAPWVDNNALSPRTKLDPLTGRLLYGTSYARKLVTAISGGVFDLLDAVFEFHSLDDLGELA